MKIRTPYKILGTIFLCLAFILIYAPIILIIIMSFTKTYSLSEIGREFSLKWYISLFRGDYENFDTIFGLQYHIDNKFISNIDSLKVAIVNTFLVTILSTIISTVFGTMFAIGIHSFNKKHRTFFNILNNMPIVNPDIVTGFLLLLVFVLFQTLFGLERGTFTVLLSHIFFSIPYVVLSVLPRLKQIDENTYEAARDLGCGRLEAILKVVIPAISTGIISGAMFAFTMSIDDFVITMFVSGTEYFNVSTWIDSSMRRGYIPKTVYAYNAIIFFIASIIITFMNIRNAKRIKKGVLV